MTDAASHARRSPASRDPSHPQADKNSSPSASLADRRKMAQRIARELFDLRPDWMTFFREVLGVGGVVIRLFPTVEERAAFERSPEYAEIQQMLNELRARATPQVELDDKEPTRVITVRLPKSMHESLRAEAYSRHVSMNKLCIAKLLQSLDESEAQEDPPKRGED